MIAPIFIACGERYAKVAPIMVETFLKHHDTSLYVVVDSIAAEMLSEIRSDNLVSIPAELYRKKAEDCVRIHKFFTYQYDQDGVHDRAYASMKPLIMDEAIKDVAPESRYILSLDADSMFSGNILDEVNSELNRFEHRFDLYMVRRKDPRMLIGHQIPGSGFTLWKRESRFIDLFRKFYSEINAGPMGGSQNLINMLRRRVPSMLFANPYLHFISPDLRNPKLTDEEISIFKPAYIHLHGKDSRKRLLRFKKIFEKDE